MQSDVDVLHREYGLRSLVCGRAQDQQMSLRTRYREDDPLHARHRGKLALPRGSQHAFLARNAYAPSFFLSRF